MKKTWDTSEKWYTSCVGEKGHYYHQNIVMPKALRLLGKFQSLLDLGCGQGVLARHIPKEVEYTGIDQSKALIESAKKLTKNGSFIVQDVTEPLNIEKKDFERASFILSLQNIHDGKKAIENVAKHLKKGGKLLIVLNHPCFRIPRQSSWGIDEKMKLQYRRMNGYMKEMEIPIQSNPGKGKASPTTLTYHHPLSTYTEWLKPSFKVLEMEEWCSDKVSTGKHAKMENRARIEFPLFLAIVASKE